MRKRHPVNWMWAEACEMLEEAERLQRQFFQLGRPARQPVWEPPVDVLETDRALLVRVALPDVTPEDIEVRVEPAALRLVAERPMPSEARRAVIRRLEIPYGRFERKIPLPAGHYELGTREYANGCIRIHLRKL